MSEKLNASHLLATAQSILSDLKGAAEVTQTVQEFMIDGFKYQLQLILTCDPEKMADEKGLPPGNWKPYLGED